MRILVLDDNEIVRAAPADWFDDPHDYREDEFVQTKDIKEFVRLFFTEEWDLVWVDHDLGQSVSGRTATKDIYNYICGSGHKVKRVDEIWITTMNPSVANAMVSDLVQSQLPVRVCPISALGDYGISRGRRI